MAEFHDFSDLINVFLQISLLLEEKNHLNETHENTKKELQTVILQLEGQLEDKRSNENALQTEIDTLKAEMTEKYVPKDSLKKLQEQIAKAEAGTKEEVMFCLFNMSNHTCFI